MPSPITLIIPYYNQPRMLARQMAEWRQYAPGIDIILVDDGSPRPAVPLVYRHADDRLLTHLRVYRILEDIPWNRNMARNLGAHEAKTAWILQTDIDHILTADCTPALLGFVPDPKRWYYFRRWRQGAADATRKKDSLADTCSYGKIQPHMDSYLMRRELFLLSPYDEDYAGCLGGGSPFIARMKHLAPLQVLPEPIRLEVYTQAVVPDASVTTLSRDKTEYRQRKHEKIQRREAEPGQILRIPWERML